MTKKQQKLVRLTACAALLCGVVPAAGAMHIMEGFLPPSMCILWGVIALPFLLAGYFSLRKTVARDRRAGDTHCDGGCVHLRHFVAQNSVRDRIVLAHDRHGTGRDLVRAERSIHSGRDCAAVSGDSACARRLDHAGREHLFYGGCRAVYCIWDLQAVPALQGEQKGVGLSGGSAGRPDDLLRDECAACGRYPSATGGVFGSVLEFLGVFAPTQLPLAVLEGVLTVMIMMALEAYAQPELRAVGFEEAGV